VDSVRYYIAGDFVFERGAIHLLERYKQLIDYSQLRYGAITPTDIDGSIEYRDRCWVFYEFKHISAPPMSVGQKKAFQRLTNDISKPALFLFAKHDRAPEQQINAAALHVSCYLINGDWGVPKTPVTIKEASDRFIARWGC